MDFTRNGPRTQSEPGWQVRSAFRSLRQLDLLVIQACRLVYPYEFRRGEGGDGGVSEILFVARDDEVDVLPLGGVGDQRVFVIGHRAERCSSAIGWRDVQDVEQLG